MVYVFGWFSCLYKSRGGIGWGGLGRSRVNIVLLVLLSVGCVFILLFGRSTLKETTFYKCVSYIVSGQATDYGKQMDERMDILLDDTVKAARLPAMNQDQGPLMHMEVTKDINGWTNQVVRDFYRKNSVIEIDRMQ